MTNEDLNIIKALRMMVKREINSQNSLSKVLSTSLGLEKWLNSMKRLKALSVVGLGKFNQDIHIASSLTVSYRRIGETDSLTVSLPIRVEVKDKGKVLSFWQGDYTNYYTLVNKAKAFLFAHLVRKGVKHD